MINIESNTVPSDQTTRLTTRLKALHARKTLRILIVRLSAIGDIAMASGLVSSLKSTYPNSEITWVCDGANGALLNDIAGISKVVCWSKKTWLKDLKGFRFFSLAKKIRNFKHQYLNREFDLCIDAQGLLKSSVIVWMAKARCSVVVGGNEGSRWFNDLVVKRNKSDTRMSSEYRDIACTLGCNDKDYKLLVPTSLALRQFAQDVFNQSSLLEQRVIIAAPFTTRAQKFWPDEYWRNLFQSSVSKGYQVLILGSHGDVAHANRLCADIDGVVNFAGKTQLHQLASLIERADGLIGVDTGITHIAVATGIPVVALFGSTCPYLFPLSRRATVLYDNFSCSPCHRKPSCNGGYDCMASITPHRVLSALEDLL